MDVVVLLILGLLLLEPLLLLWLEFDLLFIVIGDDLGVDELTNITFLLLETQLMMMSVAKDSEFE
jgi:hypothetical protein